MLSQFRLLMHLMVVSATGWITYNALQALPGEFADRSTAMVLGGFGLAAVLGLTSLVTIFVGRSIHHAVSKLFFGLAILMVALTVFAELIIQGWATWSGPCWTRSQAGCRMRGKNTCGEAVREGVGEHGA